MSKTLTRITLTTMVAGAALAAMALADPYEAHAEAPSQVVDVTVPVCELEDCSDQPNQLGVWFNPSDNTPYFSFGDNFIRLER
ncbi:hypothetical protein PBI_TOAKA_88 [Mycobacterium phage Toaka]|nr:hypothetical protein PBI_TOAKA_88 [Mycobacterium phage Toaka]